MSSLSFNTRFIFKSKEVFAYLTLRVLQKVNGTFREKNTNNTNIEMILSGKELKDEVLSAFVPRRCS